MNPSAAQALTFLLDEAEATRGGMPEADAIALLIAEREERFILNRAEADDLLDALSAAKQSRQWNATGPTITAILRAQADEALAPFRSPATCGAVYTSNTVGGMDVCALPPGHAGGHHWQAPR